MMISRVFSISSTTVLYVLAPDNEKPFSKNVRRNSRVSSKIINEKNVD